MLQNGFFFSLDIFNLFNVLFESFVTILYGYAIYAVFIIFKTRLYFLPNTKKYEYSLCSQKSEAKSFMICMNWRL